MTTSKVGRSNLLLVGTRRYTSEQTVLILCVRTQIVIKFYSTTYSSEAQSSIDVWLSVKIKDDSVSFDYLFYGARKEAELHQLQGANKI